MGRSHLAQVAKKACPRRWSSATALGGTSRWGLRKGGSDTAPGSPTTRGRGGAANSSSSSNCRRRLTFGDLGGMAGRPNKKCHFWAGCQTSLKGIFWAVPFSGITKDSTLRYTLGKLFRRRLGLGAPKVRGRPNHLGRWGVPLVNTPSLPFTRRRSPAPPAGAGR